MKAKVAVAGFRLCQTCSEQSYEPIDRTETIFTLGPIIHNEGSSSVDLEARMLSQATDPFPDEHPAAERKMIPM